MLESGYVSFGNPVTNEWFQILVENGQTKVQDLGKLNRNGRSLRETIDDLVRGLRKKSWSGGAVQARGVSESSIGRAKLLRNLIAKL